uniref:phenylalanine--tRNA ligase n=1 Tax=Crouania attenuata TaxID=42002 RepID=A0A4D6WSP4_9FLOR|nr:Phenylalanine-tRNA ligase beta subunit [Crouania attenuata]
MKFSWLWLNQLVNLTNITLNDLHQKLTLAGLEVENADIIQNHRNDTLDINITPNRPDLSCMIGLSREINIICNLSPIKTKIYNSFFNDSQLIFNKLHNHNNPIEKIFGTQIKIPYLPENKSPTWIQDYLIQSDIQSTNLIQDIQEYISLKWKYRIKILDSSNLDIDNSITSCKSFLKSYNTNQNLPTGHLSQANEERLFEHFIILGIIYKQHNTNFYCIHDFKKAYQELINLVQTYTKGVIGKSIQYSKRQYKTTRYIYLTNRQINLILGKINNNKYLSTHTTTNIFRSLNFSPVYHKKSNIIEIKVPDYRQYDIVRPIDAIEEIVRLYGFEKIKQQIPITTKKGNISTLTKQINTIRYTLRKFGLNETVNSSFIKTICIHKKVYPDIQIYNPLNQDNTSLRNSLTINILKNYLHNYKQQNVNSELFEIGKVFIQDKKNTNIIKEIYHLGGILSNNEFIQSSWENKTKNITWFHCKGLLEMFFDEIQAQTKWATIKKQDSLYISQHNQHFFHPKQQALIYNPQNNKIIGILALINPRYAKSIEICEKYRNSIYLFEINLENLIHSIKPKQHLSYTMQAYSLYPSIERDISLIIPKYYKIEKIIELINNIQRKISVVESIKVFNEYYNEKKQIRNIGLKIIYRSLIKTLSINEVDQIHSQILNDIQAYKSKS